MTSRALALGLLAAAAGCAYPGKYRDPSTSLDRAIAFTEIRERKEPRPLSGQDPAAKPPVVARVADPAEVDINSTIGIQLLKSAVASDAPPPPPTPEAAALEERQRALVTLLNKLAALIEARADVLRLQGPVNALPRESRKDSEEMKAYMKAGARFRALRTPVLESIERVWPADDPARGIVMKLWQEDRTLVRFQGFLQERIDSLDRERKAQIESLRLRGKKLRLEAFVETPKGTPTAVHLPHYDSLEEKQLQRHDRLGLAMTDAQKARFDEAVRASRELAEAAEAVRRGEKSIREAFSRVSIDAVRKLAQAAAILDDLRVELRDGPSVKQRLDAYRAALKAFVEDLKTKMRNTLDDEAKKALDNLVKTATEAIVADAGLAPLAGLAERIAKMIKQLDAPSPEMVLEALALAEEISKVVADPSKAVEGARKTLSTLEESLKASVASAAEAVRTQAMEIWEKSDLKKETLKLADLAGRAMAAYDLLEGVAAIASAPPVLSTIRVPESTGVSLETAPDTALNLQRTSRLAGDTITIRAALLEGEGPQEREVESTTASFAVREFGWHASLQPGVVLARPLKLETEDEEFGFAPAVSWMHGWTPWPEEDNLWAAFNRLAQPSIGLHAVFLNFFPDKEVEIGLGASISFGGEWIVAGAGYNLFNEGKDDGEFYYFVGTSLIPILQTIGALPGSGGAGEKP